MIIVPKVLVFDIETAPMIAYVWGRRDVNIALNQIKKEWSVIAWAAKWLNAPASSIIYKDQRNAKDVEDDKAILTPLWDLLDEADIVVTQNGERFDSKKLNARFILHNMPPPSPYRHLDTYKIVSKVADFTSHKLEYLSDKLCTKYKKLDHGKFPGQSLWTECLKGNRTAWDEMKRYNIHDVLATEELYTKLRAWAPVSAPNVHVVGCRVCGESGHMQKRGFEISKKYTYQKWKCTACGSWTQGERAK